MIRWFAWDRQTWKICKSCERFEIDHESFELVPDDGPKLRPKQYQDEPEFLFPAE